MKKKIQTLLTQLEAMGHDRRMIEEKLGYRYNYLAQLLTTGGNERAYLVLVLYKEWAELKAGIQPRKKPTPDSIAQSLIQLAEQVKHL